MCVCSCYVLMVAVTNRSQEKACGLLELEFCVVLSCPALVLETELRSFPGAVWTPDC